MKIHKCFFLPNKKGTKCKLFFHKNIFLKNIEAEIPPEIRSTYDQIAVEIISNTIF